jgi:DNA-binding NtrC family response regulator
MPPRIIVVDDDEAIRLLCLKALETEGCRVSCTGNPIDALALLDDGPADLLIIDVLLAPRSSNSDPTKLRRILIMG